MPEETEDIDVRFLRSAPHRLEILRFLESEAGMAMLGYIQRTAPVQPINDSEPEMWMQIRKDAYAKGWLGALFRIMRLPEEMAEAIISDELLPAAQFTTDPDLPDYMEGLNS